MCIAMHTCYAHSINFSLMFFHFHFQPPTGCCWCSLSLSHSQTHIHTYITPQLRCTWVRRFSFYSFMLRMGLKLVCMMTIIEMILHNSFISSLLTTLRIFKRRLSCDWWNKLISFKLCALFSKYLYNN